MRIWDKIYRPGNFQLRPHYEGDPIERDDRLHHRRLYVNGMVDYLGTDSVTSTFPITQIMMQLAVEILSRESEDELMINADSDRNFKIDALFSGGFAVKKIVYLGAVKGTRGSLQKNSLGQFFRQKETGEVTPARVAFCANKKWEQVIQERPLLQFAPGAIMPVFENLAAYERVL
jgi:hypothetical protein